MTETELMRILPSEAKVAPDVLKMALEGLKIKCRIQHTELKSPWVLRTDGWPTTFFFVDQGECWFKRECDKTMQHLENGDLVVIGPNCDCKIYGQSQNHFSETETVQMSDISGNFQKGNSGGDKSRTRLLFGNLSFENELDGKYFQALPPMIFLKNTEEFLEPWLTSILHFIAEQAKPDYSDAQDLINLVGQNVFIKAVKSHAATLPEGSENCFAAFSDYQIGPILAAMHERPDSAWTVSLLAREAGMSRSSCAARFTTLVGQSPMQYLLECRMRKACQMLRESRDSLKQIARSVGYGTTSAFSNAFKRWLGSSPGAYRKGKV